MLPAPRARNFPDSPMRKLAPLALKAQAQGVRVLGLNIGQPDLETPLSLRQGALEVEETIFAYTQSQGLLECRQAWSQYLGGFGWDLTPDQVLVTTGGSEALSFAMQVVADPGDEILVPDPCYPSYRSFAKASAVNLVPIPTYVESGYALPSRDQIEARITARTRAILVTNPSNPTGRVLSQSEWQSLVDLALRYDLFLISDEVYREFVFHQEPTRFAFDFPEIEDRVLVCDSASKRWSACGIRIGCLVTKNSEVYEAALRMARARLSAPLLGQRVVARVPLLGPEVLGEAVEEYRSRRDAVVQALAKIPGVVAPTPEGAFYTMLRLPVPSAEAFARFLLEDFSSQRETVFLAPGDGFYLEEGRGRDEVRLAFMLNAESLARAAEILAEGLEVFRSRS